MHVSKLQACGGYWVVFLACLQRISPALLFHVSQPRPLPIHPTPSTSFLRFSRLSVPAALITWLPSAFSCIPNPKVIPNLHCKYTDFKPNNRGVYLKSHRAICSQSLNLLALLFMLVIHSVCQSACLYFLQMWGLLTLIFVTLSAQALSQPFGKHFRMNLQLPVIHSIPFQAEEL